MKENNHGVAKPPTTQDVRAEWGEVGGIRFV